MVEKSTFSRIVRTNLLLVVAAAVVLGLATKFMKEAAIVLFGFLYLTQAVVNLVLALAHIRHKPDEPGPAPYLLSMLLVLIIGFGACSGILVLADSLVNMH